MQQKWIDFAPVFVSVPFEFYFTRTAWRRGFTLLREDIVLLADWNNTEMPPAACRGESDEDSGLRDGVELVKTKWSRHVAFLRSQLLQSATLTLSQTSRCCFLTDGFYDASERWPTAILKRQISQIWHFKGTWLYNFYFGSWALFGVTFRIWQQHLILASVWH